MSFSASVEVDDGAFISGIPAAMEEWRLEADAFLDTVADKVVDTAKGLVAKRTGKLASTIHRDPLVRTARGAEVQIVAGDGTRYAIFQEFGTYKMAAHPYFRPAFAMAAGLLRGAGYAGRTSTTSKTRAAVKRAAYRERLRRAVKSGLITSQQARLESKRISSMRKFRG